jgi:hypothetical protein
MDAPIDQSEATTSDDEELEETIDAIVRPNQSSDDIVNTLQYIVYSPSFQVPAFYFIVSRLGMILARS